MTKIYFSMPNSYNHVPQELASTLALNMHHLTKSHPEIELAWNNYMSNLAIAAARNREAHMAMAMDADFLWFVDTDHKFPVGSLTRLYNTALNLKKADPAFMAVGALYWGRNTDHTVMGLEGYDENADVDELIEKKRVVQSKLVPTGCFLINVENLKIYYKKLQENKRLLWKRVENCANYENLMKVVENKKGDDRKAAVFKIFSDLANAVGSYQAHLPALFVGQYTERGELVTTEDYYFSVNSRGYGYNCYIDCGCPIQHQTREVWFPPNRVGEPVQKPPEEAELEVCGHNTDGLVHERKISKIGETN
jgi:hypothetical protein